MSVPLALKSVTLPIHEIPPGPSSKIATGATGKDPPTLFKSGSFVKGEPSRISKEAGAEASRPRLPSCAGSAIGGHDHHPFGALRQRRAPGILKQAGYPMAPRFRSHPLFSCPAMMQRL